MLPKIGNHVLFIRVGVLDDPTAMPPDVHIHTSAKQPHVTLPGPTSRFDEVYDRRTVWPAESFQRYARVVASLGT